MLLCDEVDSCCAVFAILKLEEKMGGRFPYLILEKLRVMSKL
jgi:hypothetical protein